MLIDGQWVDRSKDAKSADGHYVRVESQFRNWITADGRAGSTGDAGFKAEPNRYHLYVAYACPWANRTLIYRKAKGLEGMISLSVVHAHTGKQGWNFSPGEGVINDPVLNARYLHEIYTAADPHYTGRVTVPVLWDKMQHTIVSNESSEIIRMFNSAFDGVGAIAGDYYPEHLRDEIDDINHRIYHTINNGVYQAGFASSQGAYEEAVDPLFDTLDWLEQRLSKQRYLTGSQITEADWRLFTTLIRFDPVYVGHFKCNRKRLIDYSSLWGYTRDLYQQPGIAETINIKLIKQHYYTSNTSVNPTGIIPVGPDFFPDAPHNRHQFGGDSGS